MTEINKEMQMLVSTKQYISDLDYPLECLESLLECSKSDSCMLENSDQELKSLSKAEINKILNDLKLVSTRLDSIIEGSRQMVIEFNKRHPKGVRDEK
jgi:hypothetical protein